MDISLRMQTSLEDPLTAVVDLEKRIKEANDEIEAALVEIRSSVDAYSNRLDNTAPQDRFAVTCQTLERLEVQKRSLDGKLWAYFGLEESLTPVKMRLTSLQGELTFQAKQLSDVSVKLKQLEKCMERSDCLIGEYRRQRELFDGIVRRAFPRFLEDLYRLSDAEHEGHGFRLQSVLSLCGSFCSEIKYS